MWVWVGALCSRPGPRVSLTHSRPPTHSLTLPDGFTEPQKPNKQHRTQKRSRRGPKEKKCICWCPRATPPWGPTGALRPPTVRDLLCKKSGEPSMAASPCRRRTTITPTRSRPACSESRSFERCAPSTPWHDRTRASTTPLRARIPCTARICTCGHMHARTVLGG